MNGLRTEHWVVTAWGKKKKKTKKTVKREMPGKRFLSGIFFPPTVSLIMFFC